MQLTSVIFDIDGLLIDSEPLWNEAASEVFAAYGVSFTDEQYRSTTGLRTREFVQWWLAWFKIDPSEQIRAEKKIVSLVLEKIEQKGRVMQGVPYIFDFFLKKGFKIGLATSSPPELIELVVGMIGIQNILSAASSAELLDYGKPHPQVYLNCASELNSHPTECLCFEDSFNGLIAAKAARMKCVVVPAAGELKEEKWGAADLRLSSLQNFGELHFGLFS